MPHSVKIKSEEETLPRLIQTGESASSYLTRTHLPLRLETRGTSHLQTGGECSEPSRRTARRKRGGGALHIKMAGRQVERGALRTFAAEGWEHALHRDGGPSE